LEAQANPPTKLNELNRDVSSSLADSIERVVQGDDSAWTRHRIIRGDGQVRWLIPSGKMQTDEKGRPSQLTGGLLDVTESVARHRIYRGIEALKRAMREEEEQHD